LHPSGAQFVNARHAVTFALAGWYLMIPPTSKDYPTGNANAPLSQWTRRPTIYRAKEECEGVLARQHRLTFQVVGEFYKHAQCVSSTDPRLKLK
jgi:hypothetical protein